METRIKISKSNKEDIYLELIPQIKALIGAEKDRVANMANICAALKTAFDYLWVGFYIVKEGELVLGPFQGPVACTRIGYGKGVCGYAWQKNETILVEDVQTFPGHIACSAESRSEIVVSLRNSENECVGVLDIDSKELACFEMTDRIYLEEIAGLIEF